MGDKKQQTLNTLAKGAGWAAAGMFISKILTYFYRAAVARLLDPSAYGQLSMGLAVLSIVNTVALLAMGNAVRKYVPEYLEKNDLAAAKGAILSSINMALPLSILAGAIMFLSAGFLANDVFNAQNPEQLKLVIQVLAFVPPFGNLLDLTDAIVLAYKKPEYEVINEMLFRNTVQLITTVVLIVLGFGIIGAAIGWLVATVLAVVLGLYFVERKAGPVLTSKVKPKMQYRKIFRFSAPLIFGGVIGTFLGYTDTLMLGYFLNEDQVGLYNAALPTAVLIQIPYVALNKLALPSVSEIKARDEKEIPKVIKILTRWTLSLSLPIFALMVLFAEEILHLLFGNQYIAASTALMILAFGRLIRTGTGHMGSIIQSFEDTDIIFKNSVAQFIINIVLNIALIPIFGIVGAAIATAGTMMFLNFLLMGEVYYIHRIHPFSFDLLKPIAATTIGVSLVYTGLKLAFQNVPLWALIPGGAAFGAIYLISLVGLKGIKEEDREIILGIGEKIGRRDEAEKLADLIIR